MNNGGLLGEALEQGVSLVKQTGKQIAQAPKSFIQGAASQVTGKPIQSQNGKSAPTPTQAEKLPQVDPKAAAQTKEFVDDLYAPTHQNGNQQNPQAALQAADQKSFEDQQHIASVREKLRQELHNTVYYQPLINQKRQEELRPAEKVEQEKKKEMIDLQEKEQKKPQPLSVMREQNKTEMFRGASG